jgi:PIN domain nuclease of toxin-antitoxin system
VEAVIYMDTNVVVWLVGAPEQLSAAAQESIDSAELVLVSPMVELEVEYLWEVGRISQPAQVVFDHLRGVLNLRMCDRSLGAVVTAAKQIHWTRDPFDRLITAQAAIGNDVLLTRDKIIRANYQQARW